MEDLTKYLHQTSQFFKDHALPIWMIFAAGFGGLINYLKILKETQKHPQFSRAIIEVSSAIIAGIFIGSLVHHFTGHDFLTWSSAAYAGHLGTRKITSLLTQLAKMRGK